MNEKTQTALRLALEALELLVDTEQTYDALDYGDNAIAAIREALAEQPAEQSCYCLNCEELGKELAAIKGHQEPVAWRSEEMYSPDVCSWFEYYDEFRQCSYRNDLTPLYTSPPASKPWSGLTHDEYDAICDKHSAMSDFDFLEDIEAKLKEKNYG